MFLEEALLRIWRGRKASTSQTSHDFAKDGGVVFRFALLFSPHDSEHAQIVAQPGQWTLVQKASEIIKSRRAGTRPDRRR